MSRVIEFSDGAERGDTSWWTSAICTADTVNAIHGTYCYSFANQTATKTITTPLSEFYLRFWAKFPTGQNFFHLRNSSNVLATFTQSAINQRFDITGATTGNTGNNSITGGWQCFEIHYKIANAAGELTMKIDGVQVFTFTGDTQPGADTTFDNVYFSTNSSTFYLDDLALDTAAWCGLGYYIALTANGAGDSTQWTPTGGANYANVSIPANDSTYNSGTTGQTDNYALTNPSIGASSILRVIPFARANNPAGGTLNIGLRTYATNYGTAVTTPTTLTWLAGAEYTTNPNSGNAWGASELDSLEFYLNVP